MAAFIIWLCLAGMFELASLIPLVSGPVTAAFYALLTLYLYKTGHGIVSVRNLSAEFVSLAIEFFPGISFIPSIMAATSVIFVMSRLEDKAGKFHISNNLKKPGITPPRKAPNPFNKAGTRLPRQQLPGDKIINVNFKKPEAGDIDMAA